MYTTLRLRHEEARGHRVYFEPTEGKNIPFGYGETKAITKKGKNFTKTTPSKESAIKLAVELCEKYSCLISEIV